MLLFLDGTIGFNLMNSLSVLDFQNKIRMLPLKNSDDVLLVGDKLLPLFFPSQVTAVFNEIIVAYDKTKRKIDPSMHPSFTEWLNFLDKALFLGWPTGYKYEAGEKDCAIKLPISSPPD